MRRSLTPVAGLVLLLLVGACSGTMPLTESTRPLTPPVLEQPIRRLEFIGEAIIESGLELEETTVGGLSAISYDPQADVLYALPDDPSYFDPSRIYSLRLDLTDGSLETGDVTVEAVKFLTTDEGETFPTYAVDGEGLVRTRQGTFFLSSEGNIERGVQPFIREFSGEGVPIRELSLPERYLSRNEASQGVRHNLALEALTINPEGSWLFAGIENALVQDGPEADINQSSPARILRYDLLGKEKVREYLYRVEPVPHEPVGASDFRVNGLVELLALEGGRLLALERAFIAGVGNTVRLYLVDLSNADDIHGIDLAGFSSKVKAVEKTLLLDFSVLGIALDNLEGLTHGPDLPDGRHTILLISDDNFSPRQKTQVLAFAWSRLPVTLSRVQSAGHRSPYEGQWLLGVEGTVTATAPGRGGLSVWMQSSSDQNTLTSDALALWFEDQPGIRPGNEIVATGRVVERERRGNLSVTTLLASGFWTRPNPRPLPAPQPLGPNVPPQIDNDGLGAFEPAGDAIDLFESLEGMRVEIPATTVVGAASRFGDLVVLAEATSSAVVRTSAGGVLLTEENSNPQRIQIDPRLLEIEAREQLTALPVGSALSGPLVGVLDYAFGTYEVVLTETPAAGAPREPAATRTTLTGDDKRLTIATFNVENLDALDSPEKYGRVAATIVDNLGAPDILGLQEVQDDNGAEDDGVVSADQTLARLATEIVTAGGPHYDHYQIDPENNADGGQPGANIRVAYLVNPERVRVTPRGAADAHSPASVETVPDGIRLSANPGRVAADAVAFSFDEVLGYEASRKPLALEVEFGNRQIFLVNAHLKSKRGDGALFGSQQPPTRPSEIQRTAQAQLVRAFVDEIVAADSGAAVVVLGDMNDFDFRPPLRELAQVNLRNLIDRVPLKDRYSYNYRGNSQVLDHILASSSLAEEASPEIEIVHVNADFPAAGRASDHDPVVARFSLGTP